MHINGINEFRRAFRRTARALALETTRWDPAKRLTSPDVVSAYLEAAIQDGDSLVIAAALNDIRRASTLHEVRNAYFAPGSGAASRVVRRPDHGRRLPPGLGARAAKLVARRLVATPVAECHRLMRRTAAIGLVRFAHEASRPPVLRALSFVVHDGLRLAWPNLVEAGGKRQTSASRGPEQWPL